jgi:hypothetical protein
VYVTYEGRQIKADKEDKQHFTFTFHRIIKNTSFQLMADGFYSEKYELKSVPNPLISAFKIELNYPPYLQKKNETLNNTGDLLIPSGTIVKWTFNTVNTSVFKFWFNDSLTPLVSDNNLFTTSKRILTDANYSIATANNFITNKDTLKYSINVIPDQYPTIQVEQQNDSSSLQRIFFKGTVKDDYGFFKIGFSLSFY